MSQYVPVLFALIGAIVVALAFWGLATLLGPKSSSGGIAVGSRKKGSDIHTAPFESGVAGTPFRRRFTVKFYAVALMFVIFDVEAVFLYPWATIFQELGLFGFVSMFIFVAVVGLGLLYDWRKGAFEWT